MNIYTQDRQVPAEGLSARHLFWLLQEASAAHSRILGFGEEAMRALGLMWVVIRYCVQVERYPAPGERLRMETWPGKARHGMCPRHYLLRDAAGAPLLSGCALWAVVDRESRQMVAPLERGVDIPPVERGLECRLPGTIRRPVTDRETAFTVPEEYLDSNGHMNNTRYFDLAEQCIGVRAAQRGLREVTAEYLKEALCGERLRVRWGECGEQYTVVGETEDGEAVFRMQLSYGRGG